MREEFVVVEGVGHGQVGTQTAGAVGIENGITGSKAVEREADQAFVGPERVDKKAVDEKHRAQIDAKPHAAVLPAEAAEGRADEVVGVHIGVEEVLRIDRVDAVEEAAAVVGADADIVADG